ncbi:hypothetical protein PHMEG_00015977 [Phytophthora megakarya]|uniref:MULE transposase domain-containing protein n=1 Tax=Phytophthora megakarya TaxID=4795 RepID=A0A225W1J6_9STRA|nr:hypothetical protein PHMEG_00015977 [Phytophthora megakarya]
MTSPVNVSIQLICNRIRLSFLALIVSSSAPVQCSISRHATFKLSDLGHPVITCGYTDHARQYQVAAIFVVSRRTNHEYKECFWSLSKLVYNIRGVSKQATTVMGDAEDAPYIAIQNTPGFSQSTMQMCFFHVIYNVRKRIEHFPVDDSMVIMRFIMDIHLSGNLREFEQVRDRELYRWKDRAHLTKFIVYFEQQLLQDRYWKWQILYSPGGFATTNNPCENLNAVMKLFLQRRWYHMRRLLLKLCVVLELSSLSSQQRPIIFLFPPPI